MVTITTKNVTAIQTMNTSVNSKTMDLFMMIMGTGVYVMKNTMSVSTVNLLNVAVTANVTSTN